MKTIVRMSVVLVLSVAAYSQKPDASCLSSMSDPGKCVGDTASSGPWLTSSTNVPQTIAAECKINESDGKAYDCKLVGNATLDDLVNSMLQAQLTQGESTKQQLESCNFMVTRVLDILADLREKSAKWKHVPVKKAKAPAKP